MESENRFWCVSLVLYPFYNKFNRFDRWCVSENDKLLQTKSRSHGHGWHLRHESSCPSNDAEITLCRPSWLKCRYRRKQTIGPLLPWMALLLKTPRTLSVWHWHISQSICLHSRYSTAIPDSSVSVIDQWQFSKNLWVRNIFRIWWCQCHSVSQITSQIRTEPQWINHPVSMIVASSNA